MPTDDALIESLALEFHRLRDEARRLPSQVAVPVEAAPIAERLSNVCDRLGVVELLVLRLVGHPEPAPEGAPRTFEGKSSSCPVLPGA